MTACNGWIDLLRSITRLAVHAVSYRRGAQDLIIYRSRKSGLLQESEKSIAVKSQRLGEYERVRQRSQGGEKETAKGSTPSRLKCTPQIREHRGGTEEKQIQNDIFR